MSSLQRPAGDTIERVRRQGRLQRMAAAGLSWINESPEFLDLVAKEPSALRWHRGALSDGPAIPSALR